jgi:hypothetical protein
VTGDDNVTQASLARKYGTRQDTVSKHAGKEDWKTQRAEFRAKATAKALEKATTKEAEIRLRHIEIARKLQEKALERLKNLNVDELSSTETRQCRRHPRCIRGSDQAPRRQA